MIDRKTALEALDQTALHNGIADVFEHEDAMRAVVGEVFGT